MRVLHLVAVERYVSGERDELEPWKNTAHPEPALMKAISGPRRSRPDSPAASPELGGVRGLTGTSSAGEIKKRSAFFLSPGGELMV